MLARPRFLAKAVCVAFMAAVTLVSVPAFSQWDRRGSSSFDSRSFRPPGARPETVEEPVSPEGCLASPNRFGASFPQGLDGGGPVDAAVRARAVAFMERSRAEADAHFLKGGACTGPQAPYARLTASPHLVSPYRDPQRVHSVMLLEDASPGGRPRSLCFQAVNLFPDGTELTVARLFPDPGKSLPRLWKKVREGYCSMGKNAMPAFFGSLPCGGDLSVPPFFGPEATLDRLGHVTLSFMGLTFHLGESESWEPREGYHVLDIDLHEMIDTGADPELWN
ncbi:MAG: hypothetical protein LBT40_13895 [Deltaproteobacteria bacterium]|jgi:hypothetical protein|nr:hypothetical protein [Deltaproteobacteria bacterium]